MSENSTLYFTYLDWVVDSVSASITNPQLEKEILDDADGIRVSLIWPRFQFALKAEKPKNKRSGQITWSLLLEDGDSESLISSMETSDQNSSTLFGQKPLIDDSISQDEYKALVQEAGGIGRAVGRAIIDYLLTQPSQFTSDADSRGRLLKLRFDAYNAELGAVRALGQQFYQDLLGDIETFLPGIEFLGIARPNTGYLPFLNLGFAYQDGEYYLTAMYLEDVQDVGSKLQRKPSDVSFIISRDLLSRENNGNNNEHLTPGYFESDIGLKGIKFRRHIALQFVNCITNDLGLPRILDEAPAKEILLQSKKETSESKIKSSMDILALEIDESVVFPSARSAGDYSTPIESVLPPGVLDYFKLDSSDTDFAKQFVKRNIENQWITWESQTVLLSQFQRKAATYATEAFASKYPRFESVLQKFEKQGADPGYIYPGCTTVVAILASVIALVNMFPWVIIPAGLAIPIAALVRKSNFKPTYRSKALRAKREELISTFSKILQEEFKVQIEAHVAKAFGKSPKDWEESVNGKWKPLAPRPLLPSRELSPNEAEHFVAEYLKYFGLESVQTTRYSKDGGVDVSSKYLLVQVKHQQAPVGVKIVREMLGVASSAGKLAAVFAKSGFTKEASQFGEASGVLLFSYVPELSAHTSLSRVVQQEGFKDLVDNLKA